MAIELTDVIQSIIDRNLNRLYTTIPAIVTDVSKLENENVVSVQPAIQKVLSSGFSYDIPVLLDLPVQWPAGGGGVMTFPIKKGDDVLVVFSMASKAEWWLLDDVSTPFDRRLHNLSDGFVIPSVFRKAKHPNTNPDDVEIRYKDGEITIKEDSTVEFNNANGSVTIHPDGQIVVTNGTATNTLNVDGSQVLENPNGSITLLANGDGEADCPNFTFTGNVQVDGSLNVDLGITSLVSVTAPAITGSTSVASPSVSAGGTEMAAHTHGYDDSGTPKVTDPV